jgi:hypothetical protein
MNDRPLITLTFQSDNLSDDELQSDMERLLPQLREVEGIEDAHLVTVAEAPANTKSVGGFVLGALKFTIDNSKILTGLLGVGNAIVGNGKTVKFSVEGANGEKFSAEARSVEELAQMQQMATAFLDRQG